MLTEAYIEALLVDEDAADLLWEALDSGQIDSDTAYNSWIRIAAGNSKGFRCRKT